MTAKRMTMNDAKQMTTNDGAAKWPKVYESVWRSVAGEIL